MGYYNKITATIRNLVLSRADSKDIYAEYYRRTVPRADYRRQAESAKAKAIEDWKRALLAATNPDNPRRGELMRFYTNLLYDNHLTSCIDNRILPVQCAPFKLVDKDNNEDKEAHRLLEKPWYMDAARIVCDYTFEGTQLLEMFDLNDKGELAAAGKIPQSNFIPQAGIIVREEWDQAGVSYKEGFYRDYYVQVGGDWNLGMLNRLAFIVLAKKLGLGSWLSYIDKYGVPPLFAITDRLDAGRRDELFDMLQDFRQNQFAVLQGQERIEVPANYNVDAYNTFKSLITDIANAEMSKAILGSTGMTDEKSFVGSAEVGERLFQLRVQVDKLLWKYYFNEEIRPRLVKLSPVYKALENLTFKYDETETLSVKEIIDAVAKLAPGFEFDTEELAKITGLPITKIRSITSELLDDSDPDDDKIDTRGGLPQKKKIKPDSFVPNAPSSTTTGTVPNAASWDSVVEQLAEKAYRDKLLPAALDKDSVLKTYAELNRTAAQAWGGEYYTNPVARQMRSNLFRFAGAKTHDMLAAVLEAKAGTKTEKEFIQAARQVAERYNGAWLDTERRNTANAANSARDWQGFMKDNSYVNLKYRTMADGDVRSDHRALEGIILPKTHPHWATYATPNGQGCRCWLEQTNERPTEPVYIEIPPQFAHNPGADGIVFNAAVGYMERVPQAARREVRENTELLKFYAPYGRTEKAGERSVYVSDFADPVDLPANLVAAKAIARETGKDVYIRPHIQVNGHKNPEFAVGTEAVHGDLKNYQATVTGQPIPLKKFIKNQFGKANKQGCTYVVLNLSDQAIPDIAQLPRTLAGELNNINHNLQHVIIIRGKKAVKISRKEVENRQFGTLGGLE